MNRISFLLPLALLTGCQDSDIFKVGSVVINSITETPELIPRDRPAGIPYATMGLQLGATPEILLVLGTQNANEFDWYGGEELFVRTRNGRILRTVGLPYDLGGVREAAPAGSNRVPGSIPASAQYLLDFPDLGVFGATAECTARDDGDAKVQILGSELSTRHIVEHCRVQAMRWNFDNQYWINSGFIWRSRQYVHPDSPPVNLEVFRPAQNPAS